MEDNIEYLELYEEIHGDASVCEQVHNFKVGRKCPSFCDFNFDFTKILTQQ
jgi:hypothetical protein